jgi:hypothetical protein
MLDSGEPLSLRLKQMDNGMWSATLLQRNKTTMKPIAIGFGNRKEVALRNLEESIGVRCEDYYGYCRTKYDAKKERAQVCQS